MNQTNTMSLQKMKSLNQHQINIKKVSAIVECFDNIETFNLAVHTQKKIAHNLHKHLIENKKLKKELQELKKELKIMKKEEQERTRYIQNIVLTLESGKKYAFYGSAIPETIDGGSATVVGIEISKPVLLPDKVKITNVLIPEDDELLPSADDATVQKIEV